MKYPLSKGSAFIFVILLLLSPTTALGWGDKGHTDINRVAAQHIPKSMPGFMRTHASVAWIAYLGPEPDRWRGSTEYALNNAQAPDHFIDLERIDGLGDLPLGRYEFYKLLYAKRAMTAVNPDDYLPERVGLQPYITMEIFDRLKAAFRTYRQMQADHQPTAPVEKDIVFFAGWLGHYVADGSQPLHTTIQYDGWVGDNPQGFTTQHGIHREFETDFVSRNINASGFQAMVHTPEKIDDPFAGYQKYLWASHALVERVYELDKAKGFDGSGSPEAIKFTEERLAAGCQELLDLWYTAWLESAEPIPPRPQ